MVLLTVGLAHMLSTVAPKMLNRSSLGVISSWLKAKVPWTLCTAWKPWPGTSTVASWLASWTGAPALELTGAAMAADSGMQAAMEAPVMPVRTVLVEVFMCVLPP